MQDTLAKHLLLPLVIRVQGVALLPRALGVRDACALVLSYSCGECTAAQESYSITSGVLDADPFAGGAYPVHLAAAVELRRTSDLFLLGHRCSFRLRTDERVHTLQGRPGLQLSSCHLERIRCASYQSTDIAGSCLTACAEVLTGMHCFQHCSGSWRSALGRRSHGTLPAATTWRVGRCAQTKDKMKDIQLQA